MSKKKINDYTVLGYVDENSFNIAVKMIETDDYNYGHYELEDIASDYDCYDWNEDEQLLVDYAIENDGYLFQMNNGIGDFSQPIGLIAVI